MLGRASPCQRLFQSTSLKQRPWSGIGAKIFKEKLEFLTAWLKSASIKILNKKDNLNTIWTLRCGFARLLCFPTKRRAKRCEYVESRAMLKPATIAEPCTTCRLTWRILYFCAQLPSTIPPCLLKCETLTSSKAAVRYSEGSSEAVCSCRWPVVSPWIFKLSQKVLIRVSPLFLSFSCWISSIFFSSEW